MGVHYGSDSNTISNPCSELAFYIGELGGGIQPGRSVQCGFTIEGQFDDATAKIVNDKTGATYGYWFLLGARFANNCTGTDLVDVGKQWGQQQAQAAVKAYKDKAIVKKRTIFGDVEQEKYWQLRGSEKINLKVNRAILEGFIEEIKKNGFIPGVYSAPCAWAEIVGSDYMLPDDVVTWTYQKNHGEGEKQLNYCPVSLDPRPNEPCGSSYQGAQGFGGLNPTIWQYHIDPDYNVLSTFPQ